MRTYSFRTLLQSAVTVALASPIVGCDSSIEDDPGFATVSCGSPYNDVIAGLNPDRAVEYLDIRAVYGNPFDVFMPSVVSSRGVVCGGAVDQPSCNAAFAKVRPDMSFNLGPCGQLCTRSHLTATRGDTILVLDNPPDVTSFLGSIDTPQEAMLLIQMRGFGVPCGRGGAKPIAGGFEVQAFTNEGCDGRTHHHFNVMTDGSVREVDTVVEKEADPSCNVGRRPAGLMRAPLRAQNATVARVMRRIAVDETRHAVLSWKVARWSEKKLDPLAVRRVREARSEAVLQLRRELRSEPDSSLVSALGVPSAREALALHAELERTLWKIA